MERHMACIRIFLNGIPDLVRPILGEYLCLLLPNSQQTLHHIYQLCNAADKAVRCSCIHVSKIFAFEWRWQRVIKIGLNSEYHLTGEITKFVKMLTHLLNYWNTEAHWTLFFCRISLCSSVPSGNYSLPFQTQPILQYVYKPTRCTKFLWIRLYFPLNALHVSDCISPSSGATL